MDKKILRLKEWGCDIDGAMSRFMNNEGMYLSFLDRVKNDSLFNKLLSSVKENDIKEAFNNAHTLKGILGNMGLTPMYEPTCEIADSLRIGKTIGIIEKCQKLLDLKEEYIELIK